MLIRFVKDSIGRAPRRKALIVAAVALGSAVATSMLGVMLSIGDKVNRELRAVGANIVVTARAASVAGGVGGIQTAATGGQNYIAESDVPKIKAIFWGNNITGFSPTLSAQDGPYALLGVWFNHPYRTPAGEIQTTGIGTVNPVWNVMGGWANDRADECMIGEGIARRANWKLGDRAQILGSAFRITGIISSGDVADDRILLPLARLQELTGRPGVVDRIDVAALTKPEDDFARRDPNTLTSAELERWNCTNYVVSIAREIEQAIPGTQARPVRRVADSEGKILNRVGGLMGLITLAALLSAGLTVWSLTATTMMERRGEVAIMQAIGGARWLVGLLLGAEIALIGAAGGVIGALAGVWLSKFVGASVFGDAVQISPVLPGVIVLAAVAVSLAGAAQPLQASAAARTGDHPARGHLMFIRFIARALRHRKQRLILAFTALAVAATLATVLFSIYATVAERIRAEFSSYGANIVAVSAAGSTVPLGIVSAAEKLGANAAPFLITSGRIGRETVAVAGFVPAQTASMTSYWHVQGTRDIGAGQCLAGELIASDLRMKIGSRVSLERAPCLLRGIVSTGGAEDREILVPFEVASKLAGVSGVASVIEIRAPGAEVEQIRSSLATSFPAADVRTVRSVTGTESNVVMKIRATLFLLTLLILTITTLCVSSNFTEMVIERSKEIGILKALGAAERRIAAFFVSESAALALIAAIAGYIVGNLAAAAIGVQIFRRQLPHRSWLGRVSDGNGGYAVCGGNRDRNRGIAHLGHSARHHPERRVRQVGSFIELIDVKKVYGQGSRAVNAIDGISFEAHKGEWIAIMGPSGSGKTTLAQPHRLPRSGQQRRAADRRYRYVEASPRGTLAFPQ